MFVSNVLKIKYKSPSRSIIDKEIKKKKIYVATEDKAFLKI